MQIESISLRGVGPFDDQTVEFPNSESDGANVQLLVGPNGAGKSTVLYSIASAIGGNRLGKDLGSRRLIDKDSVIRLQTKTNPAIVCWKNNNLIDNRHFNDPDSEQKLLIFSEREHIVHCTDYGGPIFEYYDSARNFNVKQPKESWPEYEWAIFAYAGIRDISDVEVTTIQEPTYSPFENSLSFVNTAQTSRLAEWVANQEFKRLKAKEAGDLGKANSLKESISNIENLVTEIIGKSFQFATSTDDNNIRVNLEGNIVDLGVLPDGLKSIVSWIADLLMRLDRIPWKNNTPVMERSFTLLLDEVDIHLHPAWQRKVLPMVQRVFPNAQIIVSTHSPFVISSLNSGWIHPITINDAGRAEFQPSKKASEGDSYISVLEDVMGISEWYDIETEALLTNFREARESAYHGASEQITSAKELAQQIAARSPELQFMMGQELSQMERQLSQVK